MNLMGEFGRPQKEKSMRDEGEELVRAEPMQAEPAGNTADGRVARLRRGSSLGGVGGGDSRSRRVLRARGPERPKVGVAPDSMPPLAVEAPRRRCVGMSSGGAMRSRRRKSAPCCRRIGSRSSRRVRWTPTPWKRTCSTPSRFPTTSVGTSVLRTWPRRFTARPTVRGAPTASRTLLGVR